MKNGSEFPGQVYGIANPGVHALPADRTVYMCSSVAQQECAPASKLAGHTMMHVTR
jgi:hypothetical protein